MNASELRKIWPRRDSQRAGLSHPGTLGATVEYLGLHAIELPHALGEIAFHRFHNDMLMVGHWRQA